MTPSSFAAQYGLNRDFPLLWEIAQRCDFAERFGGCSDPLHAEIDKALRELLGARRAALAAAEEGNER
jgi:hypothetical protein